MPPLHYVVSALSSRTGLVPELYVFLRDSVLEKVSVGQQDIGIIYNFNDYFV